MHRFVASQANRCGDNLRRKGLPTGFHSKGNKQQTNGESDRRERDGRPQGLKMLDAGAHQKGDAGTGETRKGSGEGKSAGAAFRRVLLRQPKRIDGKVRAAKTEKEKANEKPGKSRSPEMENHSKR